MQTQLADAEATDALGRRLAPLLAEACQAHPVVIHLEGPLGAGKTTLARGLLRGLGHAGRVRSPTFTLLEPYELDRCAVIHLDLYRLADAGELEFLGLADHLVPGAIVLVEWPERGAGHLPPADLRVALEYDGDGRRASLSGTTVHGRRLLAALLDAPGARAGA